MEIEWDRIGRDRFDRIVEALVNRLYAGSEIRVYDGRGGDGGKDVYVRQGRRTRIFQLKYFPDGFSSINRRRRSQIKASFRSAMDHEPDSWTLVVPCNLTVSEQEFLESLRGEGQEVKIEHLGRAALDDTLARFPDLANYFTRDDSLEKARVYNREIDLLAGGAADIDSRIRALGATIDDADPDWAIDFDRRSDEVVKILRPKHDRAQEVSPITINMDVEFSEEHDSIKDAFRRITDYGTPDSVTLPPETVTRFEISGPELVALEAENVEVTIRPIIEGSAELPIDLIFQDAQGSTVSAHSGTTLHASNAARGRSLTADFYKSARLTFIIPHDSSAGGSLELNLNFENLDPFDVLRTLQLIDALHVNIQARL